MASMSSRPFALLLAGLTLLPLASPVEGAGGYPEAIEWSPTGTSVLRDTPIRITWDLRMNASSVEVAFSVTDGTTTWGPEAFQWNHSGAAPWISQATPRSPYPAAANLTVRINATATDATDRFPLDQNGNGQGGEANDTLVWSFGTEDDTVPPRVLSTVPEPGQTGVSRSARITVTFDDAMDAAATESALALADETGYEPQAVGIGDFLWDSGMYAVSFTPLAGPLAWDTPYRVTVSQAAKDDAGNRLPVPYVFTFRTEAWTGRVIGRIVSAGEGLAGATVHLGNLTTLTNATGAFEFPTVHAGTFDLVASKAGYVTWRTTVTISQEVAGSDASTVDLGDTALEREGGIPAAWVAGILSAALVAAAGVGLLLRRRRPPLDTFEDSEGEDTDSKP